MFLHVDNISITCFDVDHWFRFWNDRPTPCKFWRNRALTCPKGVAIAVCGASLIPYLEYSVESSTSSPDADIVFTDFFASVRLFFSIQSESKKGVPKAKSHMIQNTHSVLLVCPPHSSSSFSRLFSKQIVFVFRSSKKKHVKKPMNWTLNYDVYSSWR